MLVCLSVTIVILLTSACYCSQQNVQIAFGTLATRGEVCIWYLFYCFSFQHMQPLCCGAPIRIFVVAVRSYTIAHT